MALLGSFQAGMRSLSSQSPPSAPMLRAAPREARRPSRSASRPTSQRRNAIPVRAILTPNKPVAAETAAPDSIPVYTSVGTGNTKVSRPRVVVLGSGWAAMSFIKALPSSIASKYEVVLVSPRNYFLYTPLLPAVAAGTVEERSIVEPVRKILGDKGTYYEAVVKAVDPSAKTLVACFPKDAGLDEACFKLEYDVLIVGVGSVNNTFGIKGVEEYCTYFKSVEDASGLRRRVSECFERAALPACPDEERAKLLSFVVVGGGPTGVEVAAELYDMVTEDLARIYPALIKDVRIRVVELMDHVLSTYDRAIGEYTARVFNRSGIDLVLNSRVASVRDGYVKVVNKAGEESELPFGACVWATGVAKNPLVSVLQEVLPGQVHFRSILTDDHLRVLGSEGTIWAFGDAATIDQPKALAHADELFRRADVDGNDRMSLRELRAVLQEASKEFSHLEEHARFLDGAVGAGRWGGLLASQLSRAAGGGGGAGGAAAQPASVFGAISDDMELSKEDFAQALGKIDSGLRALPATAQVAKQQGEYLAALFASSTITGSADSTTLSPSVRPFRYGHKGSLAYVGGDKAVMDVPRLGPITGMAAGFLWRGYETWAQISLRNQLLVANDWLRTKIFGRDISRV